MGTRLAKSPCCRATIWAFGGRRRQCSQCRRTWRIRQRRPGRPARRLTLELLKRTLGQGQSLQQQAARRHVTAPALRYHFRRALDGVLRHAPAPGVADGDLVLIVDGVWFRFHRRLWTLYLLAIKPTTRAQATFLDPALLPGKESSPGWQHAVLAVPPALRARVKALVSDGVRGASGLARAQGWVHQRCHFHLLAQLYGRRGRYKHLTARVWREAVFRGVREALRTRDPERLAQLQQTLRGLAAQPRAPFRVRMIVRDFLRELDSFRTYLRYPELRLPTTTNVIEAMANILRSRLRPLNTPASLRRWATGVLRTRPTMVCNGALPQPHFLTHPPFAIRCEVHPHR